MPVVCLLHGALGHTGRTLGLELQGEGGPHGFKQQVGSGGLEAWVPIFRAAPIMFKPSAPLFTGVVPGFWCKMSAFRGRVLRFWGGVANFRTEAPFSRARHPLRQAPWSRRRALQPSKRYVLALKLETTAMNSGTLSPRMDART